MRRLLAIGWFLALALSGARVTYALPVPLEQPHGVGAQLIYYYDARDGFTTFVNLGQVGADEITVRVDFYGPTFQNRFSKTYTVGPIDVRVIDVGALRATDGLPAQQGIAVASVVNALGKPIAVTPLTSLTGNFTVANLATGSAWGSPAAARAAQGIFSGAAPPFGTVVEGDIGYQRIRPSLLTLAAHYDPRSLAPVSAHGNQVIFITFKDGEGLDVTSGSTEWTIDGNSRGGQSPIFVTTTVDGVTELDLVSLLGEVANGGPGNLIFSTNEQDFNESRLVFFVQSLGTFGTGYLLPPITR